MSGKRDATEASAKPPLSWHMNPGETEGAARARLYTQPGLNAAVTMQTALKRDFGEVDLAGLITEMNSQGATAANGKLGRAEEMLAVQAHSLDAIFNGLTRLAYTNVFTHFDSAERLFRLAFKAQAQSRATWEALSATQNPPMVFAKQANVTTGPQQVNNGFATSTHAPAHAGNSETRPNELLEQTNGERLASFTASGTVGSDPAMATVGAIHRTKDA